MINIGSTAGVRGAATHVILRQQVALRGMTECWRRSCDGTLRVSDQSKRGPDHLAATAGFTQDYSNPTKLRPEISRTS